MAEGGGGYNITQESGERSYLPVFGSEGKLIFLSTMERNQSLDRIITFYLCLFSNIGSIPLGFELVGQGEDLDHLF